MANNLIKNETTHLFTVNIKEGLYVSSFDRRGGDVLDVKVTKNKDKAKRIRSKEEAVIVAKNVEGTVTEHIITEIVTELTQKVEIKEESE